MLSSLTRRLQSFISYKTLSLLPGDNRGLFHSNIFFFQPDSADDQHVEKMDQDESDEDTSESEEKDEGIDSDEYSSEDWVPSKEDYGIGSPLL